LKRRQQSLEKRCEVTSLIRFIRSPQLRNFYIFAITVGFIILRSTFKNVEAQQPKRLVETVEVMGNRRLRTEDILEHIKTRPGDIYSEKQIQLDLQAILALGVFDKTQTQVSTEEGVRGGTVVLFEVMEMPMIKDVKFEGLRNVKESEIIDILHKRHINIAKGAVCDPAKIRKAVQIIREFLTSHYWSNVTVTSRLNMDSATEVSLTLIIEGNDYSFIETAHNNSFNPTP
jgi:outer membrane protein assembly factor BamA